MVMTATHANSAYKSIITLTEVDVEAASNDNGLNFKIQMQSSNNYNFSNIGSTIKLKIDGIEVYSNYAQRSIGKNTTVTMAEGKLKNSDGTDYKIKHNSDGSKSINVEYTYSQTSTASYTPKAASVSGTMTLTTIPRETWPNVSPGYVEGNGRVWFEPASTSFKHSIKITCGTNVKYINSNGILQTSEVKLTGKDYSFQIPKDYYNEFTGKSTTATAELNTYSNDLLIGSVSSSFIIYALEDKCLPYLTGTLKDINSTTTALTGDANKLVKGYSIGRVSITSIRASSANDSKATISELKIGGTSVSTSTTTKDFNKISSKTVDIYVKNSRGYSKTFTLSATALIDYIPLTINADFKRTTQTGSEVKLTYKGNYFNQSFGSVSNTLTLSWAYKKKSDSSYTSGGTLTPTISGNAYSGNISCGSTFPYTEAYDFIIYYADKLVNTNYKDEITKGVPLFAVFQDGCILVNGIPIAFEVVSEW
jgi:hypothetical protein|nr:MAG TPA: protein of unknown function DUF859 [Caudoviricetes sp.]